MDFEKRLTEEIKNAMKSGDKMRLMGLRAVKSAILTERTKTGKPVDDDLAMKVVASHRKKIMGAREQYEAAGRDEMVREADAEIAVCESLLPKQLTPEDIAQMYYDMTGLPACMTPLAGDVDGDCLITVEDVVLLATEWLDCGLYPPSECP